VAQDAFLLNQSLLKKQLPTMKPKFSPCPKFVWFRLPSKNPHFKTAANKHSPVPTEQRVLIAKKARSDDPLAEEHHRGARLPLPHPGHKTRTPAQAGRPSMTSFRGRRKGNNSAHHPHLQLEPLQDQKQLPSQHLSDSRPKLSSMASPPLSNTLQ
jgi:hypothetical protein